MLRRALIVTTSAARVGNIRQAITSLQIPPKAKQFIWLTHTDRLREVGIFQPVWLSGDEHDPVVYRIG